MRVVELIGLLKDLDSEAIVMKETSRGSYQEVTDVKKWSKDAPDIVIIHCDAPRVDRTAIDARWRRVT